MVIPTLISNCAPFTPIVAVYHPNRTFKAMGFMKRAPFLTLVDSNFLLATPKDYFVAGIGDTVMQGILFPILFGIGCSMALDGSYLGPILSFAIFEILIFAADTSCL